MIQRIRALRVIKCMAQIGGLIAAVLIPSLAFARDAAMVRLGDRLKITFFEGMEVPDPGGNGGGNARMQMFYQRVDLSGEYLVEPGAKISLPILGAINVEGQTIEGVKTNVLAAMTKIMGRGGNVTVSIAQRPPVYVAGAVRSPGAYPYAPGMIAIQALALAGGIERNFARAAQFVELMRQQEANAVALGQLKRALARKAVLVAERDNSKDVTPPPRLIEIAGNEGAAALIAAERSVADLHSRVQQKSRANNASATAATHDEIELIKERLGNFDEQVKARADQLQKMEGLLTNRIVADERVASVRRDYLDIEARRNELKVSLLQATQRLGQSDSDLQKLEIAHRLEIEQEINQIDAQIAGFDQSVLVGKTISALTLSENICGSEGAQLEILRRGANDAEVIQATDTSVIEPGDVLRVGATCEPSTYGKNKPR
jgi:protein involved in polysaccharide export with SLBB domain